MFTNEFSTINIAFFPNFSEWLREKLRISHFHSHLKKTPKKTQLQSDFNFDDLFSQNWSNWHISWPSNWKFNTPKHGMKVKWLDGIGTTISWHVTRNSYCVRQKKPVWIVYKRFVFFRGLFLRKNCDSDCSDGILRENDEIFD